MNRKVLLLFSTIGLLYHSKIVLMTTESDIQDAIDLERLFNETFSNKSIDEMAASIAAAKNGKAGTAGGPKIIVAAESKITFRLFTRSNPLDNYPLLLDNAGNLNISPFRGARTTKVIIHGWQSSASEVWVKNMTRNYLLQGDYNVIAVDWAPISTEDYVTAEEYTRLVGQYSAKLLKYLRTFGKMKFSDVHILGHSLGAHVAGFAGANVSGAFSRITGLDPAGPLFETPVMKLPAERLDSTDAIFVDIIHTCAGIAGFYEAIGHIDFYPNSGTCNQPGCTLELTCSHARAHDYMSDSIMHSTEFVAIGCNDFSDYKDGKCLNTSRAFMGERTSSNSRGIFYLTTNSMPPYGKN